MTSSQSICVGFAAIEELAPPVALAVDMDGSLRFSGEQANAFGWFDAIRPLVRVAVDTADRLGVAILVAKKPAPTKSRQPRSQVR